MVFLGQLSRQRQHRFDAFIYAFATSTTSSHSSTSPVGIRRSHPLSLIPRLEQRVKPARCIGVRRSLKVDTPAEIPLTALTHFDASRSRYVESKVTSAYFAILQTDQISTKQ